MSVAFFRRKTIRYSERYHRISATAQDAIRCVSFWLRNTIRFDNRALMHFIVYSGSQPNSPSVPSSTSDVSAFLGPWGPWGVRHSSHGRTILRQMWIAEISAVPAGSVRKSSPRNHFLLIVSVHRKRGGAQAVASFPTCNGWDRKAYDIYPTWLENDWWIANGRFQMGSFVWSLLPEADVREWLASGFPSPSRRRSLCALRAIDRYVGK